MTTKKLLTGAALLGLGVTAAATFRPFERGARAQYGEPAQGKSDEGGSSKKGSDQGAKQTEGASGTNAPDPELGTRGESGRAGPVLAADAGTRAEPQKAEPSKGAEPESSGPESNKFQQNKKGGDRDPIPPGNETASPTTRQSRPW